MRGAYDIDQIKRDIDDLEAPLDLRETLKGYMDYNERRYQELLEGSVRGTGFPNSNGAAETFHKMLKAVKHGDIGTLSSLGCIPTTEAKDEGWRESSWNIGAGMPRGSEKAALGTILRGDAVTGSYLIPEAVANEVLRVSAQNSVTMGRVRSVYMGVRKIVFPSISTNVSLAWPTDESTAKSETNPTFSTIDLEAKTCAAWMTVSDELEEDAVLNLGQFFMTLFSEAWGSEVDKQVLTANAAPFTGILYAASVNDVTMGTGKTSFANVGVDDLYDMQDALTSEAAHFNATWIMSRYVFNALRKLKDDNGRYIIEPAIGGEPGTLLGKGYIISEQMPGSSSDAPSTPFLIYGDLKNYLMGTRVGMDFKRYDETVRNIDYDQIFYRFRVRAAFIAGRPDGFVRLNTAAS